MSVLEEFLLDDDGFDQVHLNFPFGDASHPLLPIEELTRPLLDLFGYGVYLDAIAYHLFVHVPRLDSNLVVLGRLV